MQTTIDTSLASATQDANKPVTDTVTKSVTPEVIIRTIDRSKKDVNVWRTGIIAFESVYYPNQRILFDLYSDILLDGHLSGIIKKRIAQVKNKKLSFKVGEDKIDEMDKTITSKAFRDMITQFILAKVWGLSGLEFVPGEKLAFNEIPRKHIKRKTQMITYEQTGLTDGISYADLANVWIIGEPHDMGLLVICGFYALLKKKTISNWAEYIELFGSPVMILKYKGHDLQARKAGERIVEKAGNSMKIVIPEEMGFDMKDGKMSNGDGQLQETFVERMNQEMSMIILGNTDTSTKGAGSHGKAETHSEEQKQLMKDDMDDIIDLLNSDHFMNILRSYNLPVEGGRFEYDGEADMAYLEKKLKIDIPLITQTGLKVSKKYLYDTYFIPEPEDGDDCIELMPKLGQPENENEPDIEDGRPIGQNPKPKPKGQKTGNIKKPTAVLPGEYIDYDLLASKITAQLKDANFFD